jgi:hypothetical protein
MQFLFRDSQLVRKKYDSFLYMCDPSNYSFFVTVGFVLEVLTMSDVGK